MKKFLSLILVSTFLLGAFSGCGKNQEVAEPEEVTVAEIETTEETTQKTTIKEADSNKRELSNNVKEKENAGKSDNWKTAYQNYLKEFNKYIKETGTGDEEIRFWIDYLNNDDVPELFVSTGCYHVSGVKIAFYNTKTKSLDVFPKSEDDYSSDGYGVYGSVNYVRKEGKVVSADAHQGSRSTHVYDFSSGEEVDVWGGVAAFPEFAVGSEVSDTYEVNIDGLDNTKVTRQEYENQFSKYVPKETLLVPSDSYDETSAKTDSNGRKYYSDEEGYRLPKDYKEYIGEVETYELTQENIDSAF